ncbi:MAG TPA: hypothetical protein VF595_08485 [Tepidisphaeraceae bacterium]
MSRLDDQITRVRNKLTADLFLQAWAQALLNAAAVALAYVLVRTFTPWRLPYEWRFLIGLLAATAAWGLFVALRRRPDALTAATAIDGRLNLHEKFSTALHARQSNDPFAHAAVLDAEQAAHSADARGVFALHWPRLAGPALALAVIAAGVAWLVPPRNLLASSQKTPNSGTAVATIEREKAKVEIQQAIAKIDQMPKAAADPTAVRLAKAELEGLLQKPDLAPDAGRRKALSALQDLEKAVNQAQQTQRFADAKNAERMLEKMAPGDSESGAVADAQRDLAKGNFDSAVEKLQDTVGKFDQMSDQQKQDAARQMQQMAKQLEQMANDPKAQQKAQQQMQQMGMSPQQAQQAQQLMQQAASGNQQAQQQLQQMAQQAMKQMNNGQGPTQQQMQQAQQQLQQMQAQANGQQQAQQLQQAAAQMAQAMQQAAGANPQQATQTQQGQSQQAQQAQQGQQANAAQQPGQQQQQPGQQGAQPNQQQMQQAMSAMQQQMQQMQAAQQDAQQVAAAQQGAQQAAADAQAAMNGQGQGEAPADGAAPPGAPGAEQKQPGGAPGKIGGRGHTASRATGGQDVPFTVDKKTAPGIEDDKGRMLAGSLVKDKAPKGESKAALANAARSAEQDAADEVDSDRVGKQAQKAVRDYFGSMTE